MKADLREALGKAVYAVWSTHHTELNHFAPLAWEELDEEWRELDRREGEAALKRFLEILVPGFLMQVRWSDGRKITEEEFYRLFGQEGSAS